MGEFAKRSDGTEIKIGVCDSMYYIRWDQKKLVTALAKNVDCNKDEGLHWRLPFKDELSVQPGDFENHERSINLEGFCPEGLRPGTTQFYNKFGILINVPCYHGAKLPENSESAKFSWNGKAHAWFELTAVVNVANKLGPVIKCKCCGLSWTDDTWKNIEAVKTSEIVELFKIMKSLKYELATNEEDKLKN